MPSAGLRELHGRIADALSVAGQRYTGGRQQLVAALESAGKPLSLPELLALLPHTPQSSAYRNLATLAEAGVVQRLQSSDEFGRFELAEAFSGHHHHHVRCTKCGTVVDVELSPAVEKAFAKAESELALSTGFSIHAHEVAFEGICKTCRS